MFHWPLYLLSTLFRAPKSTRLHKERREQKRSRAVEEKLKDRVHEEIITEDARQKAEKYIEEEEGPSRRLSRENGSLCHRGGGGDVALSPVCSGGHRDDPDSEGHPCHVCPLPDLSGLSRHDPLQESHHLDRFCPCPSRHSRHRFTCSSISRTSFTAPSSPISGTSSSGSILILLGSRGRSKNVRLDHAGSGDRLSGLCLHRA